MILGRLPCVRVSTSITGVTLMRNNYLPRLPVPLLEATQRSSWAAFSYISESAPKARAPSNV